MMRLQTFYLPSASPLNNGRTLPFALIVDRVPDGTPPSRLELLHQFGRDIGAVGVLVIDGTVQLDDDAGADSDEPADGQTYLQVDPGPLGAAVARAVRTHLETQGGTLRGAR